MNEFDYPIGNKLPLWALILVMLATNSPAIRGLLAKVIPHRGKGEEKNG